MRECEHLNDVPASAVDHVVRKSNDDQSPHVQPPAPHTSLDVRLHHGGRVLDRIAEAAPNPGSAAS
jgi:hypothetical protein